MTVHLFGATSSPSCANYALRRTAIDSGHHFPPETGKTLKENFYVDDCVKSVSTENEAVQLVADLVNLCAMGGFNLTKFVSNSRKVLLSIPKQDQSPQIKEIDLARDYLPAERALGIYWNVDEDVIGLSIDTHRFTAALRT